MKPFLYFSLSLLLTTSTAFATMQYGRYLTVTTGPTVAQTHLLAQTFQVRFPKSVTTVGDAVRYLLLPSGYRLAPKSSFSAPALSVFRQPLPDVDRTFGPMTLQQGLQTLMGSAFQLGIDPIHRLVWFDVKPAFQSFNSPTTR